MSKSDSPVFRLLICNATDAKAIGTMVDAVAWAHCIIVEVKAVNITTTGQTVFFILSISSKNLSEK